MKFLKNFKVLALGVGVILAVASVSLEARHGYWRGGWGGYYGGYPYGYGYGYGPSFGVGVGPFGVWW